MGAPVQGRSIFKKPIGYWKNEKNVLQFLLEIKGKYNLNTPEDWNSITTTQIQSNGGSKEFSMFELKCMACPEGKSAFNAPSQATRYWENEENVDDFISELKEKYNLNTPEDWKRITRKHIQSQGGGTLLHKYTLFELKCMGCPEGKSIFHSPSQLSKFSKKKEIVDRCISELKEKYNLHTPEDWNSITRKQIRLHGGGTSLNKYSMHKLKLMAFPEEKLRFNNLNQVEEHWMKKQNILSFLTEIKEKYNLNAPEDWNSITSKPKTQKLRNSSFKRNFCFEFHIYLNLIVKNATISAI